MQRNMRNIINDIFRFRELNQDDFIDFISSGHMVEVFVLKGAQTYRHWTSIHFYRNLVDQNRGFLYNCPTLSFDQNLGSKSSFSEDDLVEFGYMWCGLKSSQAARLSETAVDQFMGVLRGCVHFEPNTRGALVSRSISVSGSVPRLTTCIRSVVYHFVSWSQAEQRLSNPERGVFFVCICMFMSTVHRSILFFKFVLYNAT